MDYTLQNLCLCYKTIQLKHIQCIDLNTDIICESAPSIANSTLKIDRNEPISIINVLRFFFSIRHLLLHLWTFGQ